MRWLRLALALGVVLSMPLWTVTEDATAAETAGSVKALALQWFDRLQKGVIDRSQLAPEYSAQLTAAAIQAMAKYLNDHAYGVPPEAAEIVEIRSAGTQTFYLVKLLFPRGDALTLLLGLNTEGKIVGIDLMSMAGD